MGLHAVSSAYRLLSRQSPSEQIEKAERLRLFERDGGWAPTRTALQRRSNVGVESRGSERRNQVCNRRIVSE